MMLNWLLGRRYITWKNNTMDSGVVCLTFDDGPSQYTEKILNILDANSVRAVFFLVGENIENNISLARDILVRGHIVGVHGYHHIAMTNMTIKEFINDLNASDRVFKELCGKPVRIYRPPYGYISLIKLMILWCKGYKVVMWSKDIKDYESESEEVQLKKMNDVCVDAGDIFLFHDTCCITSVTLEYFIQLLHEKCISIGCGEFID